MDLSIIFPCYNEANRIGKLLDVLPDFDKNFSGKYEIIFVNDGSSDNTVAVISEHPFVKNKLASGTVKIVDNKQNGGKGFALKSGVEVASGKFIATMDADLSYHPNELIKWRKLLGGKFNDEQILVGSRLHPDSKVIAEKGQTDSVLRKIVGYVFNFFVRAISQLEVSDTQSGFKLYPYEAAKQFFGMMRSKGWAHDVELLLQGQLKGYEIKEMPVECYNREGSKISLMSDSIKMFLQLIVISISTYFRYLIIEPIQYTYMKKQLKNGINSRPAIFRILFVLMIVGAFFVMPHESKKYGITGDEWIQNDYAHDIYHYFFYKHQPTEAGFEKVNCDSIRNRAVSLNVGRPNLLDGIIYYSGGYEFLCAYVYNSLHTDEYTTRHFLNSLFGVLCILIAGLLAKNIGGWRAGFFTVLFLLLSPRFIADCMNNPKDIPFAMAYVLGIYYIVQFLKQLQRPSINVIIGMAFSIALAINIRIGGLLLINYYLLFIGVYLVWLILNKKMEGKLFFPSIKKLVIPSVIIIVLGYFGGLIFWPYALQSPLSNPFTALKEMTNFSVSLRLLFAGDMIMSNEVPWNYIPKWISITTPEIILALFLAGAGCTFLLIKKYKAINIFVLLFAIIFPWAYAVYKNSSLYDGWRHFLFIYPLMVIIAALFIDLVMEKYGKVIPVKIAVWAVIVIGLCFPARFMYANHPNECVYFNNASGGINAAYKNYETDYWMNSAKQAFDWLVVNEHLDTTPDTLSIRTNCAQPMYEYLKMAHLPNHIHAGFVNYKNRMNMDDWDYGIFYSRFIEKELLDREGFYPPTTAIHVIKVDTVPIIIIIKRNKKLEKQYLAIADKYLAANNLDSALIFAKKTLDIYPENVKATRTACQIYAVKKDADAIIRLAGNAIIANPMNGEYYYYLGMAYLNKGDRVTAKSYLGVVLQMDPNNQQVLNIYKQL